MIEADIQDSESVCHRSPITTSLAKGKARSLMKMRQLVTFDRFLAVYWPHSTNFGLFTFLIHAYWLITTSDALPVFNEIMGLSIPVSTPKFCDPFFIRCHFWFRRDPPVPQGLSRPPGLFRFITKNAPYLCRSPRCTIRPLLGLSQAKEGASGFWYSRQVCQVRI